MPLPRRSTGSLYPCFHPDRHVRLTVKLAFAIALHARLPTVLSQPWETSVTLLEVTTPVKLPTKQCPHFWVRNQTARGWYFNVSSKMPGDTPS